VDNVVERRWRLKSNVRERFMVARIPISEKLRT
jgi:hypothetical protein